MVNSLLVLEHEVLPNEAQHYHSLTQALVKMVRDLLKMKEISSFLSGLEPGMPITS